MKLSTGLVLFLLTITCVQAKPASKLNSNDEDVDKRGLLEGELPQFDALQDEEKRSGTLDNELQEQNEDKRDLFEGDVNDEDDLSEFNDEEKRSMLESKLDANDEDKRSLLEEELTDFHSSLDEEKRSETLEKEQNEDKRDLFEENIQDENNPSESSEIEDKRSLLESEMNSFVKDEVEGDLLEDMDERDFSMDAGSERLEDELPENGDKRGLPEENGLLKSDKDKRNLLEDEIDENDFSEVEEY